MSAGALTSFVLFQSSTSQLPIVVLLNIFTWYCFQKKDLPSSSCFPPSHVFFSCCCHRCLCNTWETCFDCCLACSPRELCLGVSVDHVCCFWRQTQLVVFKLQPCSHGLKHLHENKVMTLHTGLISREIQGFLLWDLKSLAVAAY